MFDNYHVGPWAPPPGPHGGPDVPVKQMTSPFSYENDSCEFVLKSDYEFSGRRGKYEFPLGTSVNIFALPLHRG